MKIEGKVAIITGGAAGFGSAFAERFLSKGYRLVFRAKRSYVSDSKKRGRVVLADMNTTAGHDLIENKFEKKFSGKVIFVPCDVRRTEDLENVWRLGSQAFGQIDVMINNAGITEPAFFYTDVQDKWKSVVDINLVAVISGSRIAISHFAEQAKGGKFRDGGVILNLASLAAFYPQVMSPVYSATKAGVLHFTRSLSSSMFKALESSPKIRAVAICRVYL